ncbi:hypothetical protein ACHAQD_011640 [Fusarium lateritium]
MLAERVDPVYVAAVSDRPDLLTAWDLIKGIIHQRLDTFEATRQKLTCLSLIHYGIAAEAISNPITIYISVDRSSDETQWDSILTNIENTLEERGWSDLQVHIEHDEPDPFPFTLVEPQDPFPFTLVEPKGTESEIFEKAEQGNMFISGQYQDKINIGDDIGAGKYIIRDPDGVLCNTSCGTLGCYLEVKTKSKPVWTKVGLTNYRVVRPAFEGFRLVPGRGRSEMADPVSNSQVWKVDQNGWKRKPPTEVKPAGLESPSRIKHSYSTWKLRSDIRALEKRVKKYRDTIEAEELAHCKENLAKNLEFFNKNKQNRIEIIGVSGFARRTQTGHRLDWALIDIPKERQGSNRLPDRSAWNNCYHSARLRPAPSAYGAPLKNQRRSILPFNNQINHLPRVKEVWKLGAATGLSQGEFSELKFDVMLKDTSHLNLNCSNEYSLIHNHFKNDRLPSSGPGDSGSAVFDDNGCIVGLLCRGQSPQRSQGTVGLTYVTPIEYVLADIKAFFGDVFTDIRVAKY